MDLVVKLAPLFIVQWQVTGIHFIHRHIVNEEAMKKAHGTGAVGWFFGMSDAQNGISSSMSSKLLAAGLAAAAGRCAGAAAGRCAGAAWRGA